MKRQRGRGRRPGGGGHQHSHQHQNPNRSMESAGPEGGKVRGPAAMIHERYLQLARDASSSGDRVLAENYLQHAEHYFRLWRSTQPATPPPQMNDRSEEGADGEEDTGAEMESADEGDGTAEGGDQPDADFPQGERPQHFDRDGDRGRNRGRGRRSRYRPNDGEGGGEPREAREGGEREGGEPREDRTERREAREDRGERRERRPSREPRDENAGPEGFSNGPKPAFLRND